MLMVRMTPNQMGSKPAARITGMRMGVVIRMMAAGGRNMPATSSIRLMAASTTHLFTCISPMLSATDCVTCSEDIM
jgi:hypothetical protein